MRGDLSDVLATLILADFVFQWNKLLHTQKTPNFYYQKHIPLVKLCSI